MVIVKAECPRHPGRYTMGEPCDRCVIEQFKRELDRAMGKFGEAVRQGLAAEGRTS